MALDPLTYPRPRLQRAGPPTTAGVLAESVAGQTLAPPRTRIIPWHMNVGGSARKSISAGPFTGPAIITAFTYETGSASDPLSNTVELGTSLTPITENNVALSTKRPYTLLTERLDPFNLADANAGSGFLNWTIPNTKVRYENRLGFVITLDQFFLVIAMPNAALGAVPIGGHLTLLEAVSYDMLTSYLGS